MFNKQNKIVSLKEFTKELKKAFESSNDKYIRVIYWTDENSLYDIIEYDRIYENVFTKSGKVRAHVKNRMKNYLPGIISFEEVPAYDPAHGH